MMLTVAYAVVRQGLICHADSTARVGCFTRCGCNNTGFRLAILLQGVKQSLSYLCLLHGSLCERTHNQILSASVSLSMIIVI